MSDDKPTIGFIGLGAMGAAMVEQLQQHGYRLTVLANRARTAVDAAVQRGAAEADTARTVAENSDIVMFCVDTSASVESRMNGDDGVIAGLTPGKVVIDFGTSLPESTRRLGAQVAAKGAALLDAPLGRTPAMAREGRLNIMGAGDKEAFERVRPVLEVLGENVFYFGALGTGHTIKLINNFVTQSVANVVAEAFAMAEAAGLDGRQVYDAMSAGPGHSGIMDFIKAYALDGDNSAMEFSIQNARKDILYYAALCDGLRMPSLMSAGAKQAFLLAERAGMGQRHVSEMVDFYRGVAGGGRDV
ncbi:MAG: NAD(P)-dependent oxidoreductase [Gammaproteobacteria bacterium]|nr:NAD(P)-dependent oxidoreductase [Gammaproteobacteria bacterium]